MASAQRVVASGLKLLAAEVGRLYGDLSHEVVSLLLSQSSFDGTLSYGQLARMRATIAALTQQAILGSLDPLSGPYAQLLLRNIDRAIDQAIEINASGLVRTVERASNSVQALLATTAQNRLQRARGLINSVFGPVKPYAIDQARTWVDPRGYRLADRIWQLEQVTRIGIEQTLQRGVAQGRSALALSRELEQFLGTRGPSTLTPYGPKYQSSTTNYNAMRLARTEYARAFNVASLESINRNPFAEQVEIRLSNRHKKVDTCDDQQGVYAKTKAPIPPFHPHCLCLATSVKIDVSQNVDRLRAWIDGGSDSDLDRIGA